MSACLYYIHVNIYVQRYSFLGDLIICSSIDLDKNTLVMFFFFFGWSEQAELIWKCSFKNKYQMSSSKPNGI